jgi:hypothetical protein
MYTHLTIAVVTTLGRFNAVVRLSVVDLPIAAFSLSERADTTAEDDKRRV